jgi:hypothetical protein
LVAFFAQNLQTAAAHPASGFNGADKHIHKLSVLIVADTRMTPAHIHWVVQMLLIIGATSSIIGSVEAG